MKLHDPQLPILLASLENYFPAALNIYHLARNIVLEKPSWPGLEFFVDRIPDVTACVCRTAGSSREDIPPLINGYTVFTYASNPQKLAELISEPGVIDWTEAINFCMVQEPENAEVLKQKCIEQGGVPQMLPGSPVYNHGLIVHFDLTKSSLKYTLPDGLRLGALSPEQAEQATSDKKYGNAAVNIRYFRYLLNAGYPSSAIFNADNKPVAYILQRPEGKLGGGFVAEEYRSRGLFKIVLYELLKKLRDNGETEAYADAERDNTHSLNTMLRVGGTLYPGQFEWFEYVPVKHM